jgi:hypothetical protein
MDHDPTAGRMQAHATLVGGDPPYRRDQVLAIERDWIERDWIERDWPSQAFA